MQSVSAVKKTARSKKAEDIIFQCYRIALSSRLLQVLHPLLFIRYNACTMLTRRKKEQPPPLLAGVRRILQLLLLQKLHLSRLPSRTHLSSHFLGGQYLGWGS